MDAISIHQRMKPLLSAPSAGVDPTVWHGGNEYRGPGAWKRPPRSKKRLRSEVARGGPLDLTAFFGEKWLFARTSMDAKHDNKGNKTMRRSKTGKAGASKMRLEALSLAMAPSHGTGASIPAVGDSSSTLMTKEPKRSHPAASSSCGSASDDASPLALHQSGVGPLPREVRLPPPVSPSDGAWEEKSEFASSGILDHHLLQQQKKSAVVRPRDSFERYHALTDAPPPQTASLPPKEVVVAQIPQPQESNTVWNALRVPSATTKMAADDKYNAELLEERATLRALLTKQKQLVEAMRLRRLEACLGTPGGLGARKRGRKQMGRTGRRGRHGNNQRKLSTGERGGVVRMRGPAHSHPLLFMAEGDVQKVEQDQMRLEDAEARHLLK